LRIGYVFKKRADHDILLNRDPSGHTYNKEECKLKIQISFLIVKYIKFMYHLNPKILFYGLGIDALSLYQLIYNKTEITARNAIDLYENKKDLW